MKPPEPNHWANEIRGDDASACVTADRSVSQHACLFDRKVSMVEVLDRVLNKGAVLAGGITISVAGVDLLYLGLNILVTSVETLKRRLSAAPGTACLSNLSSPSTFPHPLRGGEE